MWFDILKVYSKARVAMIKHLSELRNKQIKHGRRFGYAVIRQIKKELRFLEVENIYSLRPSPSPRITLDTNKLISPSEVFESMKEILSHAYQSYMKVIKGGHKVTSEVKQWVKDWEKLTGEVPEA